MKVIVTFLLGLLTILSADADVETEVLTEGGNIMDDGDDGKQISWDSSSDEGDSSAQSYNGIMIQVYQDTNESPTITLGTDLDEHENVYCLNFKGFFEAVMYNTAVSQDGTYDIAGGSQVDLAEANCTTYQVSTTRFTITCNNVNDGVLTLTFTFTEDAQGDFGLEYYIALEGYIPFSDSDYNLVMVQSLNECSTQYPTFFFNDADDGGDDTTEAPEDYENTSSTEVPDNDDTPQTTDRRRRLEETDDGTSEETDNDDTQTLDDTESDSMDEEDGISSDDPNEFDAGYARFVVAGQAYDNCPNLASVLNNDFAGSTETPIGSTLVYQSAQNELHIVFEEFGCDLTLDPFVGLDGSKYGGETREEDREDGAVSIQIIIGMVMGLVVMLL